MEITLPNGFTFENAPEGTTIEQAQARYDAKYSTSPGAADPGAPMQLAKPDVAEDLRRSTLGGIRNGAVSALLTPAKAAIGLTSEAAKRLFNKDPQVLHDLKDKVDNLDGQMRAVPNPIGPSEADYQPQTTAGRFASSMAGGATAGMLGGMGSAAKQGILGAAGGALAEGASANFPNVPAVANAAAMVPNVLSAGRETVLPNRALQAVKGAATPQELSKALAFMAKARTPEDISIPGMPDKVLPRPGVPILPGQAFGPGSQMEGLQNQIAGTPGVGPKVQAQLRDQSRQMAEATASGNDPAVAAPRAPYRQMYDAASQTPMGGTDTVRLAVALNKATKVGNPSGAARQEAEALANESLTGGPGNQPHATLGGVQSVRDSINGATRLNPATQGALRDAVNTTLRTKDGRFAAADTAAKDLMDIKDATKLGRASMGSPATEVAGNNANPISAGAGVFGGLGMLAARPVIGSVMRNRQAKELARVLQDTSGKGLLEAQAYSPAMSTMDELARALLQGSAASTTGSGQGN